MIISVTDFKARCLQLFDQVLRTGETITVTKRGRVIAEVGPPAQTQSNIGAPGFAQTQFRIVGDILEPIDQDWEAAK